MMVGVVPDGLGIECRGREELDQLRQCALLPYHVLNGVNDKRWQHTIYGRSLFLRHLSESSVSLEENLVDAEAVVTVQVSDEKDVCASE